MSIEISDSLDANSSVYRCLETNISLDTLENALKFVRKIIVFPSNDLDEYYDESEEEESDRS